METDNQFEDYTIEKVEGNKEEGWVLHFKEGSCFFCPKDSPIEPGPGMTAKLYAKGFGYVVRGLEINGTTVFYRTEEEDRKKHEEEVKESKRKRLEEFDANREAADLRIAALPDIFRKRIAKFQGNNPDFRSEYEPYELFCCEQAVEIAKALKTKDAIEKFSSQKWEEQKAAVPALSSHHSGNTFGCAVQLAYLYLTRPEGVEQMYGALAPLVGSEEYGCVPRKEIKA